MVVDSGAGTSTIGLEAPMTMYTVAITVALIFWSGIAWGDNAESPYRNLARARSLECTFTILSQSSWQDGRILIQTKTEKYHMRFDNIDPQLNKAGLSGKDVSVLLSPESISFIEINPSGHPNFTTVFPFYIEGTTEFIAVSSRHVSIGRPFPSQHHGTCKALSQ
jgi:hypothetical protein